jgi:hypothetical protein
MSIDDIFIDCRNRQTAGLFADPHSHPAGLSSSADGIAWVTMRPSGAIDR